MNRKVLLPLAAALLAAGVFLGIYREPAQTRLFTAALNLAGSEFFQGSIRLTRAGLDRHLRLRIQGFRGDLKTEEGPFSLEIAGMVSDGPVYKIFSREGLKFRFSGIKPEGSGRQGMDGILHFRAGKEWFSRLDLSIHDLGLEDVRWVNRENLEGASGKMRGGAVFGNDWQGRMKFQIALGVDRPGGTLQAHFFDALRPYVPGMPQIIAAPENREMPLVAYRDARVDLSMEEMDRLKGFFHIFVPEYNINLNVNLEVRLDEKSAFNELLRVMGIIKVKA